MDMDTAHVAFLRDRYQAALFAAAGKNSRDQSKVWNGSLTPASLFDRLVEADPTPGKEYLEWLLRRYIKGGFDHPVRPKKGYVSYVHPDLAEASRLRDALEAFDFYKDVIAPGKRDIANHVDEHSIWAAVAPHLTSSEANPASGAPSLAGKGKALSETDVLFSNGDWTLVRPRTTEASKWWGRGTCWGRMHTSSKDHLFDENLAKGSLFVGIGPRGKFQFHMDWSDGRNAEGYFSSINQLLKGAPKSLWTALGNVALPMLRESRREQWMQQMPLEWLKPVWDAAPGIILNRIPEKSSGKLGNMPDDFFVKAFEEEKNLLLQKVPPERRTREICEAAVSSWAFNLQHVPENLKTADMFVAAVKGGAWSYDMIKRFGPEGGFADADLRRIAFASVTQHSAYDIGYVPVRLIDDEFLRPLMERKGSHPRWWLPHVPESALGDSGQWLELYGRLLESPGNADDYRHIPERVRRAHPRFFVKAVSLDPGLFDKWKGDVGPGHRAEAIEAALEASKDALLALRDHMTPERVMFALAHHPGAIGFAREIGYTGREYVERALEAADTPEKAHEVVWADWQRISQDDGFLEVAMARLSVEDRETLEGRLSPAGPAM